MYLGDRQAQYNRQKGSHRFLLFYSKRRPVRLASSTFASFPKVNLVSILAGTLILISVFLPWWGVDGTALGFSGSIVSWSLWSQPYTGETGFSGNVPAVRAMGLLSVLVLGLALITAAIAFLGSFAPNRQYLDIGFTGGVSAIIVYVAAVSVTLSNLCRGSGSPSCTSTPVGSAFASGVSVSWGFQTGFYLCLVGGISILVAIIFHETFLRGPATKSTEAQSVSSGDKRFCSGCGHQLQADAKFCSDCARPTPTS